jgi:hypothetical protein
MKRLFLLSILVNLCFLAGFISVTPAPADQTVSDQKPDYEMLYWESVKDSENIDMYRAYIKKFPNGIFVDLAAIKIKALENKAPNPPLAAPAEVKDTKVLIQPSGVQLRSIPEQLEEKDLKNMLLKYNFCDLKRNQKGEFKNVLRDNKDGTITDEATGLIWEKAGSWRKQSRKRADDYIDDLNRRGFAGRSNWRLPTIEELASLIQNQATSRDWLHINPVFGDPGGDWLDTCWSADSLRPFWGADEAAWVVNFYKGDIEPAIWVNTSIGSFSPQNEHNYVRAVCSIKS